MANRSVVVVVDAMSVGAIAMSRMALFVAAAEERSSSKPMAGTLIRLWRCDEPTELRTCRGHRQPVVRLAFSSDSKRLISVSEDRTVRFWDCVGGQELLTLNISEPPATIKLTNGGRLALAGAEKQAIGAARTDKGNVDRQATRLLQPLSPRSELTVLLIWINSLPRRCISGFSGLSALSRASALAIVSLVMWEP
jgi:hypothetical protein